jgi:hypothetical protein
LRREIPRRFPSDGDCLNKLFLPARVAGRDYRACEIRELSYLGVRFFRIRRTSTYVRAATAAIKPPNIRSRVISNLDRISTFSELIIGPEIMLSVLPYGSLHPAIQVVHLIDSKQLPEKTHAQVLHCYSPAQ